MLIKLQFLVKFRARFWNPYQTVRSDRENREPLSFVVFLISKTVLREKK